DAPACRMIGSRHVDLAPAFCRNARESFAQGGAQDFMRALPDDKRRSIAARLDHGKPEQKTVRLVEEAAPLRAFGMQSIEMGRGTIAAIGEGRSRFGWPAALRGPGL